IAQDYQPFWEALHPLIMPPAIRRKPVARDWGDRLGILDRAVEVRHREARGKLQKAAIIDRRVIAEPSHQGYHPPVTLHRKEHAKSSARRLRIDHEAGPIAGCLLGPPVEA